MKSWSLFTKIIASLFAAIIIVFITIKVNNNNASNIRNTVQILSNSNTAQTLYNSLFKEIIQLNQLQSGIILNAADNKKLEAYTTQQNVVDSLIDKIESIYQQDTIQLQNLNKLNNLLDKKNELGEVYMALSLDYQKSDSFQNKINLISDFIHNNYLKSDSSLFKTESVITTTANTDTVLQPAEENNSLWNRLFGKRKETPIKEVRYFVLEQMKTGIDTMHWMQDDSVFVHLTKSLQDLQLKRKNKQSQLIKQRKALDETNALLIDEVLSILHDIDDSIEKQLESERAKALLQIDKSLNTNTNLVVIFLFIFLILAVIIIKDLLRQQKDSKALLEAKLEAERLGMVKQQFLSKMSHELRSPLQSIIGYTDLMIHEKPNIDQLKIVDAASKHLLSIVNDVLDYNKLIQDQFILYPSPVNINELLQEVKALIAIQAHSKKLKLNWNVGDNLSDSILNIDSIRLKQILINVLNNAVKFTDKGSITFEASLKNDVLYFDIVDTGIGIEKDKLNIIFEEFEQINQIHAASGSGLGLSITKQLLDLMKGTITVRSELGKGAQFSISIPVEISSDAKSDIPTKLLISNTTNMVWVVDDDKLIRDLCGAIFKKNNIKHQLFAHPKEMLHAKIPIQLKWIFVDINMPDIDGKTLLPLMRNRVSRDVKIIAFTAQVLPHDKKELIELGFDDVLSKPFLVDELLNMLAVNINNFEGQFILEDKIIDAFITDTSKDIQDITSLMITDDRKEIAFILHKLSSRLLQLEYKEQGLNVRTLELEIKTGNYAIERLYDLIVQLENLIVGLKTNR